MRSFIDALKRALGLNLSIPRYPLIFIAVALVAIFQLPSSYVMHHLSLGLGIMINELVVILGIPLVLVWAFHFDRRELFPFNAPSVKRWIPLLLLSLGAVIVIDYLTAGSEAVFPMPEKYHEMMERIMSVSSVPEFFYKLFLLCFVPAICEEVFFRGFCQTSLAKYKGDVFAVLVTGALFAILHGNPWQAHLYFILGCFLSWTYAITKTLWIPIAAHLLNNAWTFTNHTLETTLPSSDFPMAINASVLIIGIALTAIGGSLFIRRI